MSYSTSQFFEGLLGGAVCGFFLYTVIRSWTPKRPLNHRSSLWVASGLLFLTVPRVLVTGVLPDVLAIVGLIQLGVGIYLRKTPERVGRAQ